MTGLVRLRRWSCRTTAPTNSRSARTVRSRSRRRRERCDLQRHRSKTAPRIRCRPAPSRTRPEPSATRTSPSDGDLRHERVHDRRHVSGLGRARLVLQLERRQRSHRHDEWRVRVPDGRDASGTPTSCRSRTQPSNPSQTCTVANATGIVVRRQVTNVAVTCVTNVFAIGGTVAGLDGSGLVLQQERRRRLADRLERQLHVRDRAVQRRRHITVTVRTQPTIRRRPARSRTAAGPSAAATCATSP